MANFKVENTLMVFSRDKYIEDRGWALYCSNASVIDKCHMHTEEECANMELYVSEAWCVPCREVERVAKKGEYIRVLEDSDGYFNPGDIVQCKANYDDSVNSFWLPDKSDYWYLTKNEYVVREIIEEEKEMFKIIPGKHVIKTREGNMYLVFQDRDGVMFAFNLDTVGYFRLHLTEELKDERGMSDFDVMEVFKLISPCTFESIQKHLKSVWKREEVKEMTMEELEAHFGHKVKIVKNHD